MTYVFIGESRSRSRLFLLSKIFLTWTYHKQKWLIQILGLKLSQNRSQDHFGTWYAHVKKIFDKRKKAWKKLALHRGSTGFRSQIWQQTHMHGAVSVEPNYIEVHKLLYWLYFKTLTFHLFTFLTITDDKILEVFYSPCFTEFWG